MIKKIDLLSTYRCFKIFKVEGIIFEYPSVLHISLETNEVQQRKGKIKLKFRYSTEGPEKQYMETHGPGPFKEEIEIPPMKSHESRQIEIRTDIIKYIPGLKNPASLKLTVLDSDDQHRGYEIVYFDLKNVEEVKKGVRNKLIFGTVIPTFLITLFSARKSYHYSDRVYVRNDLYFKLYFAQLASIIPGHFKDLSPSVPIGLTGCWLCHAREGSHQDLSFVFPWHHYQKQYPY